MPVPQKKVAAPVDAVQREDQTFVLHAERNRLDSLPFGNLHSSHMLRFVENSRNAGRTFGWRQKEARLLQNQTVPTKVD